MSYVFKLIEKPNVIALEQVLKNWGLSMEIIPFAINSPVCQLTAYK